MTQLELIVWITPSDYRSSGKGRKEGPKTNPDLERKHSFISFNAFPAAESIFKRTLHRE